MNDLTRMQCSEEIVVLGILRVVEEIMLRKPDALIVINSLLPMIDYRSEDVKMADVVDFKTDPDNSMKKNMEIEKAVKGFVGQKGARSPGSTGGTWKFVKGEKGQEAANKGGGRRLRTNKRKQKMAREDEAMEGTDLKKAMERRKKALDRRDKRMINKAFKDNERFRPKKPLSPFLPFLNKKALPPVWPAVHLINEKLKEFCAKHDSVSFFDATSIFAQDVGGGRHHLDNDLISPRGHPSELGFAVWEGRIMGRLDKIFKEMAPPPPPASLPDDDDDDDVDVEGELDDVDESATGTSATVEAIGSEHVSVGKIAAEPDEPVKLPPRESVSADDSKVAKDAVDNDDADDEEEEKENDDDAAEVDKMAIKGKSTKKDDVDKGGEEEKDVAKSVKDEPKKEDEKHVKGKSSKEDKEETEVESSKEDADNEEVKEKKATPKAAKEEEEEDE